MKAIVLRYEGSEKFYRPAYKDHFIIEHWRWHCRICGNKGRVTRGGWYYIASLGIQHMRKYHPAEEYDG